MAAAPNINVMHEQGGDGAPQLPPAGAPPHRPRRSRSTTPPRRHRASQGKSEPHTGSECGICLADSAGADFVRSGKGFWCGDGHAFCTGCMRAAADAAAVPACPAVGCAYELTERDLRRVCGDGARLEAWRAAARRAEEARTPGRVPCPNPACGRSAEASAGADGRAVAGRWACACGWPAVCLRCREPWHPRLSCDEVGEVAEAWLAWVSDGRERYAAEAGASASS
eukprot:gene37203-28990_t